jgi:hypothetical protein
MPRAYFLFLEKKKQKFYLPLGRQGLQKKKLKIIRRV